jgi:hypothetical protein
MTTTTRPARRFATTGLLGGFGAAIGIAVWAGGEPGLAIGILLFYAVCCVVAAIWSRGRGDVAAIIRLSGDERQQLLDVRATAIAGIVTLAFCLGGVIVDLARGGSGNPWALICAVGGASYAIALAVLVRRG